MRPVRGDVAPDFEAPDQDGRPVRLRDYRGRWVVLYFYPADFTAVCTREACRFRDELDAFEGLNAVVVGVSTNSSRSHAAFAAQHRLGFRLVSDQDKSIARRFAGTRPLLGTAKRVTYVLDPEGRVVDWHHRELLAASHVAFAKRVLAEAQRKR